MTRINLVDPKVLADQHLFAEYREIKMVPAALKRSLRTKTPLMVKASIPKQFTLNQGHVKFFYDKLGYLDSRYKQLSEELKKRGYREGKSWNEWEEYCQDIPSMYFGEYVPTKLDYCVIMERIEQRLRERDGWYRYNSEPVPADDLVFNMRSMYA